MRCCTPSVTLAFLLIAAAVPAAAFGQTDTGAIVGTVSDTSGGVLPGVTVTATQQDTSVVSSASTNAAGQYVFPSLRVGNSIRARMKILAVEPRAGGLQVTSEITVEAMGEDRPVCVAETVGILYGAERQITSAG